MAIQTESYIEVRDAQTALQDKIGLSDTLDNYTVDEITAYCYCGADNNFIKYPLKRSDVQAFLSDVDVPFHIETDANNRMVFTEGDRTPYAGNEDLYGRVVWLQNITNISSNVITETNCANYKLVTEMKANHYCYEWDAPQTISCGASTYGTTDWSGSDMTTHKVWYSSGGSLSYYKDFTGGEIINLSSHKIHPFFICEIGGKMYCLSIGFNINHYKSNYNFYTLDPSYPPAEGYTYTSWDNSDSFDVTVAAQQSWDNTFSNTGWNYPYVYPRTSPGQYGWATILQGFDDDNINGFGVVGGTEYNLDMGWEFHYYFKERDDAYKLVSGAGLYFKTDKIYKPIIQNGYVIGYTDELSATSDIDTWEGSTNHNIPPTPPTPPPPEGDDFDDHIMGAGSQLSGIATMWLLTRAQLIALHESFENAPANFDPLGSFISVMGLGISAFKVIGDSLPWTLNPIKIRMSNGELWTTGAEGHIVDAQVSAFQETGLRIQRKYNNFLDYSPYATHEIFIPMCGWITLPDIAVDRPITVTFIPDIESLKCRAVVSVVDNSGYRCVIGEKEGVMGAEIPFTNTGHSLWVANLVVNSADVAGEMVTGAIGAGFTKTNAQGGKYRPYEGFTIGMAGTLPGAVGNALLSGNINRTHFTTGNGSRVGFGDGENIQIKSTYHRIDKPNNYDHTVGKVCNKTGQLSGFTGFTVCENPHINFSATEREKEEIKQLLEQGVIL